jgi:hypothetical protein
MKYGFAERGNPHDHINIHPGIIEQAIRSHYNESDAVGGLDLSVCSDLRPSVCPFAQRTRS